MRRGRSKWLGSLDLNVAISSFIRPLACVRKIQPQSAQRPLPSPGCTGPGRKALKLIFLCDLCGKKDFCKSSIKKHPRNDTTRVGSAEIGAATDQIIGKVLRRYGLFVNSPFGAFAR